MDGARIAKDFFEQETGVVYDDDLVMVGDSVASEEAPYEDEDELYPFDDDEGWSEPEEDARPSWRGEGDFGPFIRSADRITREPLGEGPDCPFTLKSSSTPSLMWVTLSNPLTGDVARMKVSLYMSEPVKLEAGDISLYIHHDGELLRFYLFEEDEGTALGVRLAYHRALPCPYRSFRDSEHEDFVEIPRTWEDEIWRAAHGIPITLPKRFWPKSAAAKNGQEKRS